MITESFLMYEYYEHSFSIYGLAVCRFTLGFWCEPVHRNQCLMFGIISLYRETKDRLNPDEVQQNPRGCV